MSTPPPDTVTRLLIEWSNGNRAALERLMPIVYGELRLIAHRYLAHERKDHTLQTTAVVHEAYLKLIEQRSVRWQNRAQFFGVAAQLMRRILVDYARTRAADKRGGAATRVDLQEAVTAGEAQDVDVLALDEALTRLTALDPEQGRLVELRFFGGLTIDETAEVMGSSPATVKREWSLAKSWLYRALHAEGPP